MEPVDVTHFETPQAFRAWLAEHHDERDVLWVGYWKKATGRPTITWEESVDVALCFGWIDGIRKTVDEEAYTNRFTPRRKDSYWSARNLERYAAMEEAGLVEPSGRAAYERRPEDSGRRSAHERGEEVQFSEEYEERLRAHPDAWRDWEDRPPGYRRQATRWVMSAKRESTRERRLGALVQACAAGVKIKPLGGP